MCSRESVDEHVQCLEDCSCGVGAAPADCELRGVGGARAHDFAVVAEEEGLTHERSGDALIADRQAVGVVLEDAFEVVRVLGRDPVFGKRSRPFE